MSEEIAVNPADTASPEVTPVDDPQAVVDADPVKAAQEAKPAAVEEDPEIDFGEGFKVKKSEAARQLQRRKELDRASFAKFEEAAKIRKEWEAAQSGDPEEFLRKRGVDPVQFAIEKLQREVQMREATPEQRALIEAQAKITALEQERQSYADKQQNEEVEQTKQKFIQKLDRELPEVVKKSGLPTDPLIFRQVAGVMGEMYASGVPADPEMAAEIVADSYRDTFKSYVSSLSYDALVKQHPELLKVVREGDLARARAAQTAPARPVSSQSAPRKPATAPAPRKFDEYAKFDDWAAMGIVRTP